jgi:alanine racemase
VDPIEVATLVEVVVGELTGGAPAGLVTGVAIHSGRVRPGGAFVALPGDRTHGARHLAEAASAGAALAIVARDALPPPGRDGAPPLPLVVVDDALRALQRLAGWWRRQLRAEVVAVVGSNGKTTTKDGLVHLLGQERTTYGTPGSYNSQLGVALALLGCPAGAEVAVIEVAVSEPGEMAHHAAMVAPDAVVLTNAGTRWRRRFEDRAGQLAELLAVTARGRTRWILLGQGDEDVVRAAQDTGAVTHVHGRSPELPRFGPPVHGTRGVRVEVAFPGGPRADVSLRTPSDEILADLELAASAASLLGADPQVVLDALADHTPASTRTEIWRSPGGVVLVRDVATPDPLAVASAARTARRLTRAGGRSVVVLAPPTPAWEPGAGERLARALDAEQVDEVVAVRAPQLEELAATLRTLAGRTAVALLPSAAELRRHLLATLASGDACLVQSPAGAPLDDVARQLVESMAPTRLVIDLSAIEDNVAAFRRALGPGVRVMAMVKALAYGTDATAISLALQGSGVDALGVAGADEGVALRQAGVALPILVLLATPEDLPKVLRHGMTPLLYSPGMVEAALRLPGGPHAVHLEVDTGMHRAGLDPEAAVAAVHRLAHAPNLRLEGVMTHLACADDPDEDDATARQLDRFEQVVAAAGAEGLDVVRHAAATAGAIRVPRARYDMVRLGLGIYGLHPSEATAKELELTPAIALVSRIVQVVDVPAGERVGYGGTYVAPPGGGRVGLVPAGYHDCVPRSFSNFGHVVVAGVRCPIIGKVSMDSMSIDLSACGEADVGSDVLIYGRLGDWSVPLEEVSAAIGTISYEVMARVGPRVQRIFTRH